VSLLSRLLGLGSRQKEALAQARLEAPDLGPAPGAGPRLPETPDAPAEAWAQALGVGPDALVASAPPLLPDEAATAEAVLAHFDANRPGPASFPSIAIKVLDLVRDPKVDAAALARTIEVDPALSSGVLVLANSAVFRGVSKVETLRDAVTRLGLGEVARLAAALSTRSLYQGVRAEFELFGPTWNRLFYHATTVARAGAQLSLARKLGEPERVFLGGVLHDVGKSLALRSLAALLIDGRVARHEADSVERILHHVHVLVGAEAHREWGLPEGLAAIAEWHHLPELAAGPAQRELHVVRLTSALELLRSARGVSATAAAEAMGSARALGLGPARLQALLLALVETGEWVRMIFGEDRGGPAIAR
jgi:putative nucleotidyltransferase with HDIG domain